MAAGIDSLPTNRRNKKISFHGFCVAFGLAVCMFGMVGWIWWEIALLKPVAVQAQLSKEILVLPCPWTDGKVKHNVYVFRQDADGRQHIVLLHCAAPQEAL